MFSLALGLGFGEENMMNDPPKRRERRDYYITTSFSPKAFYSYIGK